MFLSDFYLDANFPLICFWLLLQAIDHIINSAAKSNYMSAGQISVPIVFRGPNGAAAGVGAQHSHVWFLQTVTCTHYLVCLHTSTLLCSPEPAEVEN